MTMAIPSAASSSSMIFTFWLRAEHYGIGTGRIYTITYRVTDACGNWVEQSVYVYAPLSMAK